MSKRTARKQQRRNRRKQRRGARPVQIVQSLTGEYDPDCACPLCAEAAASGRPLMTVGPDGRMRRVYPRKRPSIEVTVQGNASTWPYVPAEPKTVTVPQGCVVMDLLEYMCSKDRAFRIEFPPGTLHATIDGERCEPRRVLMPGDQLIVGGTKDPALSAMFAQMLAGAD